MNAYFGLHDLKQIIRRLADFRSFILKTELLIDKTKVNGSPCGEPATILSFFVTPPPPFLDYSKTPDSTD